MTGSSAQLDAIVVDDFSVCATDSAGTRMCTGDNTFAELGASTVGGSASVLQFPGPGLEHAVAGTGSHYCELLGNSSEVACWGTTYDFESGPPNDPADDLVTSPHVVQYAGAGVLTECGSVATSADFGCAVCNGVVACWGRVAEGGAGRPQESPPDVSGALPVTLPDPASAMTVVAGGLSRAGHACALTATGTVACWGLGPRGELGTGEHGSARPVHVAVP